MPLELAGVRVFRKSPNGRYSENDRANKVQKSTPVGQGGEIATYVRPKDIPARETGEIRAQTEQID